MHRSTRIAEHGGLQSSSGVRLASGLQDNQGEHSLARRLHRTRLILICVPRETVALQRSVRHASFQTTRESEDDFQ